MNEILSLPYNIILHSLLFLYTTLFQNMGLAIIALTILLRAILVPLTIPATKAQKKLIELKPQLDELKEKHKDDKVKLQEEQIKLYQEHGINPLSGCLPYIIQIIVLIALYQVLVEYLAPKAQINGSAVNTNFLWLDLAQKDQWYVIPVLAGITQFIMSKIMMPAQPLEIKKNDSKAEKEQKQDFMQAMQEVQGQMVYLMPLMTTIISLNFPSGLGLYWIVGNIFSIVQQYYTTGIGGLADLNKFLKKKRTQKN